LTPSPFTSHSAKKALNLLGKEEEGHENLGKVEEDAAGGEHNGDEYILPDAYDHHLEGPSNQKLLELLRLLTDEVKDLNEELNKAESSSSSLIPQILIGFFLALFSLLLGHIFFNTFDYFYFTYGFERNELLGDFQYFPSRGPAI
jgi:hypothetical protein